MIYRTDVFNEIQIVLCKGKNNQIFLFDLRKPNSPVRSETIKGLDTYCRCISISPTKNFYAVGSVGGKISIMSLNNNFKPFTFKCNVEGNKYFPVNDVCFNPKTKHMATVGSNGKYHFWNIEQKNREFKFNKRISCSLTRGSFNQNGDIFAFSVSYDLTRGTEEQLYKNKNHHRILLHSVK
jgi:mRNA export factor